MCTYNNISARLLRLPIIRIFYTALAFFVFLNWTMGQNQTWLVGYDEFPGLAGTDVASLHFEGDSVRVDSFPTTLPFESTLGIYQ